MTRRLNLFLLFLIVVLGGPVWWLLLDTSPQDAPEKPIDIKQLRHLAEQIPGQKPTRIEMELAAWRLVPGDIFAAGSGIKRRLIGATAFRLEVPGSGPVMIDSGITRQVTREMGFDRFDPKGQERINANLRSASLILITHEHPDHTSGLAAAASGPDGAEILARTALQPAQLPSQPAAAAAHWPKDARPGLVLNGAKAQAVAPGIVTLPAPSHTPGSQMVYVRLQSGAEYLFTGDIATLAVNWQELRPRARLVSDWIAPEDRAAIVGWLKGIAKLKQENPALHIVPGHDFEWLRDPANKPGVIGRSAQVAENVSGN